MKDIHNELKILKSTAPVSLAAGATATGEIIDTQGYDAIEFAISMGVGDSALTPSLWEDDAPAMGTETEITEAAQLLGTVAGATFTALEDGSTKKIGCLAKKRYVRCKVAAAGGAASLISVNAILGHAASRPVA